MNWEDILKAKFRITMNNPEGNVSAEKEIDEKEFMDLLTYRSWAWQSAKARKAFNVDLEGEREYGYVDEKHLLLLTDGKYYHPKNPNAWVKRWNAEFGEATGVYYEKVE
tara:strand:+ start:180 stop:506 length:327 start_codon:yes stop_codon:yes gene_type:complete